MKPNLFLLVTLLTVLLCYAATAYAHEEQITLTTYYPAPIGEYESLSVGSGYTASGYNGELLVEDAVGIGTEDPESELHIEGDIKLGGDVERLIAFPYGSYLRGPTSADYTISLEGDDVRLAIDIDDYGDDALHITSGSTYTPLVIVEDTGNVGIGTASPTRLLTIQTTGDSTDTNVLIGSGSTSGSTASSIFQLREIGSGGTHGTGVDMGYHAGNNYLYIEGFTGGASDGQHLVVQRASGNVGIGTTGPQANLDISAGGSSDVLARLNIGHSDTNATRLRLTETNFRGGFLRYDNATNNFHIGVHDTDDTETANDIVAISIDRDSGDVGIGTTSPNTKLHVLGNVNIGSATTPLGLLTAVPVGYFNKPTVYIIGGNYNQGQPITCISNSHNSTTLLLEQGYYYADTDMLRLQVDTSPTWGGPTNTRFAFKESGTAYADGTWSPGGADYAEYFENLIPEEIEKATVVAIKNGKLKIAESSDKFIVGVVSTFAGIAGNNGEIEEERDKHPEKWTLVSLLGQTPVKVHGSIQEGDYIELDDNGIGKKAEHWHPNVIARAMEPYSSEEVGKIKVLTK